MNQETSEIQHLVPALQRGSTDAYRDLVRQMGELLARYAMQIVGDQGTAQDVVQDAFLRIYKRRKQLDAGLELRGLCFRTVRNLARNHVRDASLRKQREQEADGMRGGEDDSGPGSQASEAWELAKHLPATLREVIELRFTFGLSRAEIAATLEVPEGTVATRQRSALDTLREQLNARAVAPVIALPGLTELLGTPQPSTPFPVLNLEELVMNRIRSMKIKLAGTVAAAVLIALLLGAGATVAIAEFTAGKAAETAQTARMNDRPTRSTPASSERPGRNAQNATGAEEEPVISRQPANPKLQPETQQPTPDRTPAKEPQNPTPTEQPTKPEIKTPVAAPQLSPEFISTPPTRVNVGEEYNYVIQVSGNPKPAISADTLPTWLALDGALLHGTPSAAFAAGKPVIRLTASNGVAPDAVQRFELFVDAAPRITSTPGTDAVARTAYSYTVAVKAEPKATLRLDNAPSWLTLSGDVVSGTPDRADAGESKEITLTATNGVKPEATQSWKIFVKSAPEFESQPVVAVKVGTPYLYEIKVGGAPEPELSASKLPGWLELKDGKLCGTPRRADIGATKKITLTATNGVKPDAKQSFKIDVEDNPDYLEMPWTIEELQDFWKVGLKWTITAADGQAFGMKLVHDYVTNEVVRVDEKDQIVDVKIIYFNARMRDIVSGSYYFEEMDGGTESRSLKSMAEGKMWNSAKASYAGKAKIKINGEIQQCHRFELRSDVNYVDKDGVAQTVHQVHRVTYIVGMPGLQAKVERFYGADTDWTAMEELSAFSTK